MIASIQSRGVMVVLWTQIHDRFNTKSWGYVSFMDTNT